MRPKSLLLVAVQLLAIGYLLFTGPIFVTPRFIGIELAGLGLIAWAVYNMGLDRLRIWPDVARGARLVTKGPYRWIRHPMYTGALLITVAWLLDHWTVDRLLVWLLAVFCLIAKAAYEESLLAKRFPDYAAYRRRTKMLIPFVY